MLRALTPDLLVAERPLPLIVGDVGARMTAIRLPDGDLVLHSPVRLDAEMRRDLDALGPVRAVIAPSKVHHLFVGDYVVAYPQVQVHGAPGLAAKRRDLRFDAVLSDEPPAPWRGVLEQHHFRGAPLLEEIVFFHPASRTLILTDLAFNVGEGRGLRERLFFWLTGAAGRFGPHRLVRLAIRDKAAARASVQAILRWDFERIIVSHGEVLEHDGHARFAAAFDFL